MEEIKLLESIGFTLPSPAYIAGSILFGIIGFAAWRYGKKISHAPVKWTGMALMLYPYAVSTTWLLYVTGGLLCAALYYFHQR